MEEENGGFRLETYRMNARINGVVGGLLAGGGLSAATLWLVLKGGERVGPHLSLLGQYLPGYRVSVPGAALGAAYGFILGYAVIYTASRIYNLVAGRRRR